MLNNDRLSHWLLGAIVGWGLWGGLFGTLLHFVFEIGTRSLALFFAAQCALQMAVTPWLFAARATTAAPHGDKGKRLQVVVIWASFACAIFGYCWLGGDFSDHTAVVVFLGIPFATGVIALAFAYFSRSRRTVANRTA